MRSKLLTVWAIIAVTLTQQSVMTSFAAARARSDSSPPSILADAGSTFEDPASGTKVVRVTDANDGHVIIEQAGNGAGFNADSTRLLVNLDSVATLYNFDPSTLGVQKEGPLFDGSRLQADSCLWSATDASTLYGLDDSKGAARIYACDLVSKDRTLLRDFSWALQPGEAGRLSKSWVDDKRFAFLWRASNSPAWRYVVVWDRGSDNTYFFDIEDPVSGITNFSGARLDKSGRSLIVDGDFTRVWRYQEEPQWAAVKIGDDSPLVRVASQTSVADFDLMGAINEGAALAERLPRSNTSRDGRYSIFGSRADGSRPDVFIAALEAQAASSVIWTHIVNCTALDNTLQKTGGTDQSDDARATSMQSIKSGDGYVEFTVPEAGKEAWCGLNSGNTIHQAADDINFAIRLTGSKKAAVIENGVVKTKIKYKAGNLFRIAVESGAVNYYKNGSLFYTSAERPIYPLLVNASLVNKMATVSNVMMANASLGTVISISPAKVTINTGESLQFTALVTGASDTGVSWVANQGSITPGGTYSAPSVAGTYNVKAASTVDASTSAVAVVSVIPGTDKFAPVISAVTSSDVTTSGVTIGWTTNEPADTQVEYGATTSYGDSSAHNPTMATIHSVAFYGLLPGTLYHYRVRSKDSSGNVARSGDFTFTTLAAADTTPPAISSVSSSNVTTGGATITWATNEASDTQVEYGNSVSYASSTPLNSAMVTTHSVILSGLTAGAVYNYRVKSKDAAGNVAVSANLSFTTPAPTGGDPLKTDYNVYPEPPPPALPAAGGTFKDPTFGTTIMRVTDGNDGAFNVTNYSYWPSFNKDSSRLFIIAGGEGTLYQFDSVNFRISNKRKLFSSSSPAGGLTLEDAIWSGTDPDVIYGHAGQRIYAYNVVSNTYTLVKDFGADIGTSTNIVQMSKSLDDNVFGFSLKSSSGGIQGYAAWTRSQNSLYKVQTGSLDEVQVDKTGKFLVVKTGDAGANQVRVKIVNLLTRAVENLIDGPPDYAPGHSDNGNGFVIGGDNWRNCFVYRSLATPHQFYTVIDFGQDWSVGSHVSMLSDDDRWLLISTYKSNDLQSSKLFRNELFLVATDGSKRVRRLAHIHSVLREYWDSPRANISRDGRFAVFTSNWESTTRKDVFIVKIPAENGGVPGGVPTGDTTPPTLSSINSSGVSAGGASITWNTSEASDTQVEYGKTTSYGSSTPLNASMVTSHAVTLNGLSAGTVYHYRVKSKDAAGNLAVSTDQTFTTASSGGGGGSGSRQNIVWTSVVNCAVNGNSLQKVTGRSDTADAGARSQQVLASGDGYVEFTSSENNTTKFVGLTRTVSGTKFEVIDFSIKLTDYGVAEVRELNVYKGETPYRGGDVFRVAVEGGAVKYYKNGQVFYTSAKAPSYPLTVDVSLIVLNGTVGNAVIASTTGTLALNHESETSLLAASNPGGASPALSLIGSEVYIAPHVQASVDSRPRQGRRPLAEDFLLSKSVAALSGDRQRAGRVYRS